MQDYAIVYPFYYWPKNLKSNLTSAAVTFVILMRSAVKCPSSKYSAIYLHPHMSRVDLCHLRMDSTRLKAGSSKLRLRPQSVFAGWLRWERIDTDMETRDKLSTMWHVRETQDDLQRPMRLFIDACAESFRSFDCMRTQRCRCSATRFFRRETVLTYHFTGSGNTCWEIARKNKHMVAK